MMDLKPATALLSGVAMMVAGVYCLDAAPERPATPVAEAPLSGVPDTRPIPQPGLSTAVQSRESPGTGARRVLRVQLEVKGGQPVLLPESIPVLAGSPVAFTVKSDTYDRFEVPGYGVSVAVAPGQPATLAFDANRAGHYPLQLASNGAVLGGLEVVTR
ncbi:MAG TPA: hypothetical protein VJM11_19310 [Nevskiaceae bacterium]|nr:hypothetical protein [Nevskiaceae bacterium]